MKYNKDEVESIRKTYPKGARVELIQMNDPYTKLRPGDQGVVDHVDDMGTVHISWDNGSRLGAVLSEDKIRLL